MLKERAIALGRARREKLEGKGGPASGPAGFVDVADELHERREFRSAFYKRASPSVDSPAAVRILPARFMPKISTNSLDRIAALRAEIETLQQTAVSELMERRNSLSQQLAEVDAELSAITGKSAEPKKRGRRNTPSVPARSLPLQELKELLATAPDKTLNIRKDNLDLQNIKTLSAANPHLLRLGGKGAWPTVTLLK